jgi:hypothetical protein
MTDVTKLRIRIPKVEVCTTEECTGYAERGSLICKDCKESDTRMRQEVTPTALPNETKLVHSTPLCRFLCG